MEIFYKNLIIIRNTGSFIKLSYSECDQTFHKVELVFDESEANNNF